MKPAPFPTGISGSGILIVFRAEFLLRKQMPLPNVAKLTYVSESKLYWNERKFQKRIVRRALRPEGAENIPLGSQVSDLCF